MYFWNINALKEDIKQGDFTDKQVISYIVLSLFLYSIGLEFVYRFPIEESSYNLWDGIDSILSIVVPIAGTLYAYRMNGGAAGKDFANKYFSIGFVLGVRFLVYLVIMMIVLGIYWSIETQDEEVQTTVVDIAVFYLWYILYFYQLGKHISETNTDMKSMEEFQK